MANRHMARVFALAAALMPVAAAHAEQADPAAARITSFNGSLLDVMKQGRTLGMDGRYQRFLSLLEQSYDLPTMTRFVVGPGWTSISSADQAALVKAFARMSAVTYAINFGSFSGERFAVDPKVDTRGPDKLVRSTLVSGSNTNRLNYRLRSSGGSWKIIDVYYDGVSQMSVQRADYASTLQAGGAPALISKLNALADRNLKRR